MGRSSSVKGSKKSKKSNQSMADFLGGSPDEAFMAEEVAEQTAAAAADDTAAAAPVVDADGQVQVPYGSPYSAEQQAVNVKTKVLNGLNDIMSLVREGAEACVDRAAVIEMAGNLEKQGEKIAAAVAKDSVYIEEVRHHHNRLSDLCDDTRAYAHEQMVADLKRAAAIRVNVMTIVQGKPPEFELEQEELDELKSVRLMLRRKFGAKNRDAKTEMAMQVGPVDQSAMNGDPSKVKANVPLAKFEFGGMAENAFEGAIRKTQATPGTWASDVLNGNLESSVLK